MNCGVFKFLEDANEQYGQLCGLENDLEKFFGELDRPKNGKEQAEFDLAAYLELADKLEKGVKTIKKLISQMTTVAKLSKK